MSLDDLGWFWIWGYLGILDILSFLDAARSFTDVFLDTWIHGFRVEVFADCIFDVCHGGGELDAELRADLMAA